MTDTNDHDHDYEFDHPDEWDGEFEEECGLMPDGQCLLAGTEHCDWDCGRLNAARIAAMKGRNDE